MKYDYDVQNFLECFSASRLQIGGRSLSLLFSIGDYLVYEKGKILYKGKSIETAWQFFTGTDEQLKVEEKKESTSTPMTAKEAIFELRSTPTYKLEPKTWEAASDEEERIRLLIEKFSFPENKDKDIRYSSITVNRMLKLAIREAISPSSKLF